MKIILLPIAFMLVTSTVFAQACTPASAKDTLNINEVSALILNGGDMHWDLNNAGYEVPKGSGIHSIFASAIWIGGYDQGGQLHVAAQTYRQSGNDFWPGPLDTTNASVDSSVCSQYDKIWKINRYKVGEFKYQWALGNVQNGSYIPDADILSWPGNGNPSFNQAHYLAPYIDVNNNGIYDPLVGGDYPKIKGDQMLWWVMNDKGNIHTNTGGNPLGIEIRASAYAYTCPQIADSMEALNYTTLYHYEIFNRSAMQYDSVYLGYWQDGDLGCYTDDYVGCNPSENYGYVYNGDGDDDSACVSPGYGLNPPMFSTIVLNGPLANPNDSIDNDNDGIIDEIGEKNLMTCFSGYVYATNAQQYYDVLSCQWGNDTMHFMFPDFPYDTSGWSEVTAGNMPADRRFLISSGPFTFMPGAKTEFDFAIVWSRDTSLAYGTQAYFDKNLKDNQKIQQWFATDSFPSCLQINLGVKEENQENNIFLSPNPVSDFLFVNYKSKTLHPHFEIMDVMGRKVLETQQKQIDISKFPQGLYLLKVTDGELQFSRRFVKN